MSLRRLQDVANLFDIYRVHFFLTTFFFFYKIAMVTAVKCGLDFQTESKRLQEMTP